MVRFLINLGDKKNALFLGIIFNGLLPAPHITEPAQQHRIRHSIIR